jgi:aryl-alcohol dehydrogenase-like predicted oxidoreductase
VYQLHRPDRSVPFEDSLGALISLKEQGKIRHIGLSNVSERLIRQAQKLTPIVSIQNRYNVDDRQSESVVDVCSEDGMAFLPWAPIQDLDRNRSLTAIAERHAATPRQIVLAWLLARTPVMLPIPGTGSVSHLEENVAAAAITLSAEQVADLTNSAA